MMGVVVDTSDRNAPTRSDRQRERTRGKLLDAGRTLIAQRGVAGLRIQEITERADVALGSFYNYFSTKEELVEVIVGESLSALAAATLPSAWEDADPAEVVAAAILRVVRLAFDDPDFARLVVNLAHADDLFLAATHPYARIALERGIADDRFEVVDIEVALTAIIGAAFALIRELLAGHHTAGAEVAFAQLALASLGLRPGEAAAVTKAAASRLSG
jgi:AcrR family transcriptional regulator